jgi:hypothetical protein
MTTFDKREEGFERKFVVDQELQFKATARRNKLLGLWAADQFGIGGDAADAYAREIIAAEVEQAGDAQIVDKIARDLSGKGVTMTEAQIRIKMEELMAQAWVQVRAGH